MDLLFQLLISLCCTANAQTARPAAKPDLPKGALILEERSLAAQGYRNRKLVLWMLNPERNPNGYGPDDPYTCPDETRGSNYSGPARVSLVDVQQNRVLNTVKIREYTDSTDSPDSNSDSIDLPYRIRPGYYYRTTSANKLRESKPIILWLRDYNGDGQALEFALFDAPACMGLQTTLIGYAPELDRVIQYPVELAITDNGRTETETWLWVDYLFSKKPIAPGKWKYEIDYRGRAGTLDSFVIEYDKKARKFRGTLVRQE
ncbi:MAG TPA: hypothetical protein PLD20_04935 [Blastocatellia bacterium]|nr:hypothetical protein [Blastocatellia bacterium]HMV83554.1 hypothetical protein [Blastocatellia bacterium]HMX29545.1 hypothetical protein [Blastocatellia bacterium]HMY74891.1 hypothetical protein [Blastocatellia bacterium]HMZ17253.1 hypothetical protein [Blastocatellia bacterium]